MIKGIYGDKKRVDKDIYLVLEDNECNNHFKVKLVNVSGSPIYNGNLFEISKKDGTIRLCGGINNKLGLNLVNKRLKVTLYGGTVLSVK